MVLRLPRYLSECLRPRNCQERLSLHELAAMLRAHYVLHCAHDEDANEKNDNRIFAFTLDAAIGRGGVNNFRVEILKMV